MRGPSLFAKAMSKGIKKGEIVKRIEEKRNKDYVRALGLLPLAGGKARKGDLLGRYNILQEFLRTSKQFGAQRRESEKKAVETGMANSGADGRVSRPVALAVVDGARGTGRSGGGAGLRDGGGDDGDAVDRRAVRTGRFGL